MAHSRREPLLKFGHLKVDRNTLGVFVEHLNQRLTSPLLMACARRYAAGGPWAENLRAEDFEQIWADLGHVSIAAATSLGLKPVKDPPGLSYADTVKASKTWRALHWVVLDLLSQKRIRLGICPETDCRRFYLDEKSKGKSACSPEHANRLRARTYLSQLKKSPRKYQRYLKRQRQLMRTRRAAGLA